MGKNNFSLSLNQRIDIFFMGRPISYSLFPCLSQHSLRWLVLCQAKYIIAYLQSLVDSTQRWHPIWLNWISTPHPPLFFLNIWFDFGFRGRLGDSKSSDHPTTPTPLRLPPIPSTPLYFIIEGSHTPDDPNIFVVAVEHCWSYIQRLFELQINVRALGIKRC